MNPEATASVLDKAAAEIRDRGWNQGRLMNGLGEVCAVGGIRAACGLNRGAYYGRRLAADLATDAEYAFSDYLRSTYEAPSIPQWNDDPTRTKDDVTAALEKAAAWVREQV